VHVKLSISSPIASHSCIPIFTFLFTACCTASTSRVTAAETDRSLHVADEPIIDKNKSASGAESNVPVASSSSNAAAVKMADETTPEMSDYWKRSTITEADRLAYHFAS
jgi:hypothetical protein